MRSDSQQPRSEQTRPTAGETPLRLISSQGVLLARPEEDSRGVGRLNDTEAAAHLADQIRTIRDRLGPDSTLRISLTALVARLDYFRAHL